MQRVARRWRSTRPATASPLPTAPGIAVSARGVTRTTRRCRAQPLHQPTRRRVVEPALRSASPSSPPNRRETRQRRGRSARAITSGSLCAVSSRRLLNWRDRRSRQFRQCVSNVKSMFLCGAEVPRAVAAGGGQLSLRSRRTSRFPAITRAFPAGYSVERAQARLVGLARVAAGRRGGRPAWRSDTGWGPVTRELKFSVTGHDTQ